MVHHPAGQCIVNNPILSSKTTMSATMIASTTIRQKQPAVSACSFILSLLSVQPLVKGVDEYRM